ncbi:hypothetical protein KW850_19365 [Bacillus sp. sid0103]|nr:hypothetical protein [Bacillus sp. sid0103]
MKLRQEKFKQIMKIGNSTVIIHSELCRLSSDEKRQWFEEEIEKGNPVLLDIQRAIGDCYSKRIRRGEAE